MGRALFFISVVGVALSAPTSSLIASNCVVFCEDYVTNVGVTTFMADACTGVGSAEKTVSAFERCHSTCQLRSACHASTQLNATSLYEFKKRNGTYVKLCALAVSQQIACDCDPACREP